MLLWAERNYQTANDGLKREFPAHRQANRKLLPIPSGPDNNETYRENCGAPQSVQKAVALSPSLRRNALKSPRQPRRFVRFGLDWPSNRFLEQPLDSDFEDIVRQR